MFLKLKKPEAYTGHAIRRTATTWLAERGASSSIIQKFGGWKSSSVAQEYIDNTDSIRQTIAEKISGIDQKSSTTASADIGIATNAAVLTEANVQVKSNLVSRESIWHINAEKVVIKNIWNSENVQK
jgi:hypothetical protein